MALENKVAASKAEIAAASGDPEKEKELDLKIMTTLAKNLIDDSGYEVIEKAMDTKDPAIIIGQFLMQLGAQLAEKLPFDPSPDILLAKGGWVEQISDYLQEEYNIPRKIMDRAEIFIAYSAQQMAQSGSEGQQAQGQQPAAQAMPQSPDMPALPAMPQGGA